MDTKKLIRTLDAISYETKLEKNLKNTLRKVGKNLLMDELNDYRLFLKKRRRLLDEYTYRIKSLQSINLKDNMIGIKLKDLYDKGIIQNEDDFKEELKKCIIY
ncbi:hypothetical protein NE172_14750 [Clostridium botulinum]|uniref:Uncharacterized protein n=1 Tax=Clostridium botulinum TaxID=1491 RepID=A0A6B4JK15_CLOBO|nr:hypothetical protein [Clostridium botulinum]EES50162.1 hypothetical protein CLO_1003 [Clostridium botulinum E1 str. 'BoNT E Beluga']MBY6760169.1 hypothetical protein [Clostridium botulinum]MBY6919078.1 hypothetical protein [Clostridium botulinum]MCR1132197.1 hypothetical protein [Clostridium botulinum]NFJ57279.1 hypothetical protein [Clostridium botulinum]